MEREQKDPFTIYVNIGTSITIHVYDITHHHSQACSGTVCIYTHLNFCEVFIKRISLISATTNTAIRATKTDRHTTTAIITCPVPVSTPELPSSSEEPGSGDELGCKMLTATK